MIRLVQRRLIIPRGDTGTFSLPVLPNLNTGNAAVFTIMDLMRQRIIFQQQITEMDNTLTIRFEHEDTVNLPVGKYYWDIKFYQNPVFAEGKVVDGTEVDSYYAAFTLPECEIRQTGDKFLTAEDAPTSTLDANSINIASALLSETSSLAAAASEWASSAEEYADAAALYASAASSAAEEASEYASHYPILVDSEWFVWSSSADEYVATGVHNPTLVSELENDAGYLTSADTIAMLNDYIPLSSIASTSDVEEIISTWEVNGT